MTSLRVATFNLLHGMSPADGSSGCDRLRAAANALDADIAGLQEVDRHQERSGGVDQTGVFAAVLDARWSRFVPALHGTPGTDTAWTIATEDDGSLTDGPAYGVSLVSRVPVTAWHVLRFPAAPIGMPLLVPGQRRLVTVPDEPRVAIAAVLAGPAGPMTVATAHLSFVPGWNVRQLRAINRWVRKLPAPRLLLGDLNLPGPIPEMLTGMTRLARVPTYPALAPRVQFDHVLSDGIGGDAVRDVTALPLPVSDHCALAVDLDL